MAFSTTTIMPVRRAASMLRPRGKAVLGLALLVGAIALAVEYTALRLVLGLVAATLGVSFFWSVLIVRQATRNDLREQELIESVAMNDAVPVVLTGTNRVIRYCNPAAEAAFGAVCQTSLADALGTSLANPGALLFHLESGARADGHACREMATRDGLLRISVHSVGDQGFLWRIETVDMPPQQVASDLPVPQITVAQNDTVVALNAAACDILGEAPRTLDQIFPRPPLRPGLANDVVTTRGSISCVVFEMQRPDSRREVFLLPDTGVGEHRSDGWAFFDELPVPLLKLASNGRIHLSNRPARELLGVNSCAGLDLDDVMEGLGRSIIDWIDDAATGRGTVHDEFLRVKRDDKEVFVQVTLNRVTEAGQTVLIAVLSDATKLKSLEAQFVQSQKMQAIGQLAGGVAHDFNNLLTAISGHCDLLLLRHEQDDADFADLVQINQNVNRAAALVSQLLAYSRKQTLRPEVMDIRDMLSDLAHLLNRLVGERVSLNLSHDSALWNVRADKRQLEQVLMNLVVNARDAMPEGGEIRVVTENLTLDAPMTRDRAVVARGRYVSVRVTDDGMGIPADKLQKVFEPFVTTKRPGEGTGLGLSTAYGIMKQTGGFIFVQSQVGKGTEFQLLLPAHDAEVLAPPRPEVKAPQETTADGVVLLVEDEAPVRAFASRALKLRGFTVLEAGSAEEALELLSDTTVHVDVFVTDVVMPGIDGPGWVRQARKTRPDTKVIFISGYAEETFAEEQARIRDSVFLPKPFSLSELTETVQNQLIA